MMQSDDLDDAASAVAGQVLEERVAETPPAPT
jgi:hypothetical protein